MRRRSNDADETTRRQRRTRGEKQNGSGTNRGAASTVHRLQRTLGNRRLGRLTSESGAGGDDSNTRTTGPATSETVASRSENGRDRQSTPLDGESRSQEIAAAGVATPGRPLPNRELLEAAFGTTLGDIRIHDDSAAATASRRLDAAAYATATHLAVADPPSVPLLAHEVAHILQQRNGVAETGVTSATSSLERQADRAAERVVRNQSVPRSLFSGDQQSAAPRETGMVVQRAVTEPLSPVDAVASQRAKSDTVASRQSERAIVYKTVKLRAEARPKAAVVKTLNKGTPLYVIDSMGRSTTKDVFWYHVRMLDGTTGWLWSTHVKVGLPDMQSFIYKIPSGITSGGLVKLLYGPNLKDSEASRILLGLVAANRGPGKRGIYLPTGTNKIEVRAGYYVWVPSRRWIDHNISEKPGPEDGAERDPDWSGTDIPPAHRRTELREEAEAARKRNKQRDTKLEEHLNDHHVFDRIIVGSGFATVLHLSVSNVVEREKASSSSAQQNTGGSLPTVIAIGRGDPWQTYKSKPMGQSPTLLSPQGFVVPPLHFMKSPTDRYLSSDAFANAIAWNRDALGLSVLHGTVINVTKKPSGKDVHWPAPDDSYRVSLALNVGRAVSFYAKRIDILSGPGPNRRLQDETDDTDDDHQITTDDREELRKEVSRETHTWRRLIYGEEALQKDRAIPPAYSKKRILIYGGAPTAAWAWERYHEQTPDDGSESADDGRPYELYWVAPLLNEDPVKDPETNLKRAFAAVELGERNDETLKQSKAYRHVAELKTVTPSEEEKTSVVSVSFEQQGKMKPPPIDTFDQIVVAIGREPKDAHGAVSLLADIAKDEGIQPILEGMTPLVDATDDEQRTRRPIGVMSGSGNVRALGTAGVSVAGSKLVSKKEREKFDEAMQGLVAELPPETRVPGGIAVAGIMISLANDGQLSLERKLNINTASPLELVATLTLLLDGDADLAKGVTKKIMKYRTKDEEDVGDRDDTPNYRGFETIWVLRKLLNDDSKTEGVFETIKWTIRV